MHSVLWIVDVDDLKPLFCATKSIAAKSSNLHHKPRAQCKPYTVAELTKMCLQLDPSNSFDAAVLAAVIAAFWGIARISELTIHRLDGFDPAWHISISHISTCTNRQLQAEVTVLHSLWTKSAGFCGEKIIWAKQSGPADPNHGLQNHLRINNPMVGKHLFLHTITSSKGPECCLLTRNLFITHIHEACQSAGISVWHGHSFRIGGTLEYLLRGNSFDQVKYHGCWASDAFRVYLWQHAEVLAPYIQADPGLHAAVWHHAVSELPPIRG